jgi:hypothetical protein
LVLLEFEGDPHYGAANFGHNEARNGYSTVGEYRVQLPGVPAVKLVFYVADGAVNKLLNLSRARVFRPG